MATRWDLIKATLAREPVSNTQIVSDIRSGISRAQADITTRATEAKQAITSGVVKTLQPVSQAGARYRAEHPESAQRISQTKTAAAIRAPIQLRVDINKATIQATQSEKNMMSLSALIDKAPIQNNFFVGTDQQYKVYEQNVNDYEKNRVQYLNSSKEVETLNGQKLLPKSEKFVSKYIPTLTQVGQKGKEFQRAHPKAAATIYKAFERGHEVGQKQLPDTGKVRQFTAGYVTSSYDSLQKQPIKTSVSFGIGLATVATIKGLGVIGKSVGLAGPISKTAGKVVLGGVGAAYAYSAGSRVYGAKTPYEKGAISADIVYTELLPMGTGAGISKVMTSELSKIPRGYRTYYEKYPELLKARSKLTLQSDKVKFDAFVKASEAADIKIKPKGSFKLDDIKYIPKASAQKLQSLIMSERGSLVYGSSVSKIYFKGARKAADIDIGVRGGARAFANKAMKIMIETKGIKPENVRVKYNKKYDSASVDVKADGIKWSDSKNVHHAVDVHSRATMEGLLEHGVPTRKPSKIDGQEVLSPGEQLTRKSIDSILQLKDVKGRTTFGAAEHRAVKDLDDFIYMASEMNRQGFIKAERAIFSRSKKVSRMQDIEDALMVLQDKKPIPRQKVTKFADFNKLLSDSSAKLSVVGAPAKRGKPLVQKEITSLKTLTEREPYKKATKTRHEYKKAVPAITPKRRPYRPATKKVKPKDYPVAVKKVTPKKTPYKPVTKKVKPDGTPYRPATTPYKTTTKPPYKPAIIKKEPYPPATKVTTKKPPIKVSKETKKKETKPPVPLIKPPKTSKKKKAKKQPGKQIIIYTATDINNHVASLQSLFG